MIDIHSHLLYGVDDGSKSLELSIKMLEAAAKDGITSIILTPHFSEGLVEKIEKKIEILRPEAEKFNIELFSGCEYDFSQLRKQETLITLGGRDSFVLIDFCLSLISPLTINSLFECQRKGYKVILAHPERLFRKNDLSVLKDLADANIYFQINAGSLMGEYGRRARRLARIMLKKGLCHFIASDAHSVKNYSGQIPACRKYVAKRLGTELEEVFFDENPQRVLIGKSLISVW